MDLYIVTLTILGVVVLLTAWLPLMMRRLPLSLPIACLAIGALLAWSPFPLLPRFNPLENREFTERMTEIVVIVALMGAGLKLDRPIGWKRWMTTWRLLGIAMPLTIVALAFLGSWILGLGAASALLLGACLAPTDPVLASDVQVGPPQTGEEDEVRFALTSEAGLNDGLSFPFVHLAIALALAAKEGVSLLQHWAILGKAFGFCRSG
ncbi:NhaP-type Na+/H+ or K+/H+ antiporter [Rhizobium pisi]|uniref:NhaP-type Na+/H+ or K+/H+ antiporter n=1 Tax=Rhizobium pisi TaxID=574561 RepID=A0A7W5BLT2_9HYPH|nr:cation:proton antiporter [Rhizobium pisi]MBB3135325.1 NhaP-type Na+/H+ or K+/H+ antiporter [Rhizobium pisi]